MVAVKAAEQAGKILMENFGKVHTVSIKEHKEIVTETDLQAEKVILDIIRKEFPEHSILSEESGRADKDSRFMWVVDPLDGTTNYSIRVPFFNVSIGLAEKVNGMWEVKSGVVHAPVIGETFSGERGNGAFLNGERIHVSAGGKLEELLLVYCNGPTEEDVQRTIEIFGKLKPVCRDFNRARAGALELAFVACGRLGAYVSPGGKPWDAAAGQLLVREAGGKVSDFQDRNWVLGDRGDILASNGNVHQKVLEIIGG